ncbi:hypothetical protein HU200_043134 [Digitaria exilis]|uniref:Uncharacterized protein n=1 Tax=Digitaria exilis TaxID=1010633 RepID=A0A835EHZ2_9POAL|nr:hypothetical protein HU200_043134 [Digitaria exilis]
MGPRSVWLSDEEVRAYEAGQAPCPCTKYPEKRCRYGILAERGVVPSKLGYGWYCGNGIAFWIRNKYDIPLQDDELLFGTILDEYIKEKRCRPPILEAHDTLIKYWRLNRILYPRPLSRDERAEKRRKLEEERHLERQRDAVRAPGSILRKEKDKGKSTGLRVTFAPVEPAVNKGKGVVVISSDEDDGWGDDEILSGCESD